MENPFKTITPKDWLYIGGAVASLAALAFIFGQKKVSIPAGVQTDVQSNGGAVIAAGSPSYTNYNRVPLDAVPLMSPAEQEAKAAGTTCACQMGCAGPSQLDDGSAYSGLNGLLAYYRDTNPNYVALYQAQLKTYAAYFANGETYGSRGVSVGVSPIPLTHG